MSRLSEDLDRYLAIRRGLGFRLDTAERVLRRFAAFADGEGAEHVSTALFLRWQETFGRANQQTWARRLSMVRLFAQWLCGIDPRHEVPPRALIPGRGRRARPYIYSDGEIRRILEAAAELPSINGIRALTCSTLFGLIAVSGLRIGEAVFLDAADVDLEAGILTLRRGKGGTARLLPLAASTTRRLAAYASERDRLLGATPDAFFVSDRGGRLTACGARGNFAAVCQTIGLRPPEKYHRYGRGPRLHDLRHTFAVRTLINWYRTGQDPAREMIKLTSYLGHASPVHTYWYIEAVPDLLELASERAAASLAWEVRP
ncbi:MAG TPA: tyrosine-type recombinase/integrase [Azospirillum sp.]|nr:tyrosine-type recombinase/integrase [Azospirillum sp.]